MKRSGVRVALLCLVLLGLGAAGYELWRVEQDIGARERAARAFDARARAQLIAAVELRAAGQAYVAAGQGDAYWAARVRAAIDGLRSDLAALRDESAHSSARTAFEAALTALDEIAGADARVREYIRSGEPLMASDLIFADGLEQARALFDRIEDGRAQEEAERGTLIQSLRRRQAYVALAGVAGPVLLALLFIPAGARAAPREETPIPKSVLDLRPERSDERARTTAPPISKPAPAQTTPAPPSPRPRAEAAVDLPAFAELCTNLGRVVSSQELPPLLERLSALLGASGVVVWVADAAGGELRPALAHGYSPQVLARIGPIARDADNATAAAYRTATMRVVKGEANAEGAIVTPLITTTGCIGAMAIAVKHGGESQPALRALASIAAAQFASMVSAAPAVESTRAEAGAS